MATDQWEVRSAEGSHVVIRPDDGQMIARFYGDFDSNQNAFKRANLFKKCPRVLEELADLINACEKELPEHVRDRVLKAPLELLRELRR